MEAITLKSRLILKLNLVMIPDNVNGGYGGYYRQFPEVLAQGENETELEVNLVNALHDIWESQKKDDIPGNSNQDKITIEKTFKSVKEAV